MRSPSGQVLGYQLVSTQRIQAELAAYQWVEDDGPKYLWFSSDGWKGGRLGLPEPYNHLPLGYFEAEILNPIYADALILAEGPLKCAIAASEGGLRVLATPAGGRFAHSNGQLYQQLVEAIKLIKPIRVILAVDAGMLENRQISKAYYDTFRALESMGIELQVLWWNQINKASGDIDDLVLSGRLIEAETITYDQYFRLQTKEIQRKLDSSRAKGFKITLKREAPVKKAKPVDVEARRVEMRDEMMKIVRYAEPGILHVFQDGCGMGKTTQLMSVFREILGQKDFKGRILVLTKTIAEAQLLQEIVGSDAFFMGGRNHDKENSFFCHDLETFRPLAEAGHNATKDYCLDCLAYREVMNVSCKFVQAQRKAQKAKIVTSTYGAFLSDSTQLETFDIIVIDESLFGAGLTIQKVLNMETLTDWIFAIRDYCARAYPDTHPIWPVLAALKSMLNQCTNLGPYQTLDAGAAFLETYGSHDLSALYQAEWSEQSIGKEFSFEVLHRRPSQFGFECDLSRLQKRLLVDLLEALTDGKQRVDLTRAGIVFERQRTALEILKNKVVINLDGTPPLALLNDIWGDKVQTYGQGGVAHNANIVQVTGPLYSANIISANPTQLRDLETIVNHFIKFYKAPLVAGAKSLIELDEDTPMDEKLKIEHPMAIRIWYGNQTRASNNYQSCDSLILAGCYQPPLADIRRKVNALRTSEPGLNDSEKKLMGISIVSNSFSVPGREQYEHADLLVQSVVDNAIYSEVVQAIGRLRPLTRPDETFDVKLITGLVIPGLPVDTVIDGRSILDPEKTRNQRPHLYPGNQIAANQAQQRIEEFLAENPGSSIREIMQGTGLASATVQKYRKAIIEAIPGVSPMPDINTNMTMVDTPGIQSQSAFSDFGLSALIETQELEASCVMLNGEPTLTPIGTEWCNSDTFRRKQTLQLSLDPVIEFNALVDGLDSAS